LGGSVKVQTTKTEMKMVNFTTFCSVAFNCGKYPCMQGNNY